MKVGRLLLCMGIAFFLVSGCRSREKRKGLYDVDGGYVMRKECDDPGTACHMACIERSASIACARCCRDQSYLCDMQQKHSFDACENEQ